jgi:hypothetical protein
MNTYYNTNPFYNPIKTYQDFKGRVWREEGIPKWIFRTGNESLENLHPEVVQIYTKQLENNPGYELFYFSDKDRLEFIKDFNNSKIETAYNKLVPIAFKADLFKFLIVYTHGGIYMDFSMECLIPLNDVVNGYNEILTRDKDAPNGLCVGFFGSVKETKLLRIAIEKCIHNITHNRYGVHPLDVTGPLMFGGVYKELNNVNDIPLGKITKNQYVYDMADQIYIYDGDSPIIKTRIDNHYSILYNDKKHDLYYGNLWHRGQIYMEELVNIFQKYSLDKLHNRYDKLYIELLNDTKNKFKNVLEIGIGTIDEHKSSSMHGYKSHIAPNYTFGNSLRAWRDYFVNANIYGIDIDENTMFEEERIKTFCSNSADEAKMNKILSDLPLFDMIIDDGLHNMEANLETLKNCFPYLKSGGIYVIEDVNQLNDWYVDNLITDNRFLEVVKGNEYTIHTDFTENYTRIITIIKN